MIKSFVSFCFALFFSLPGLSYPIVGLPGMEKDFAVQMESIVDHTLEPWVFSESHKMSEHQLFREIFGNAPTERERRAALQIAQNFRDAYQFDCRRPITFKRFPTLVRRHGFIKFCLNKKQILFDEGIKLFANSINSTVEDVIPLIDLNLLHAIQDFGIWARKYDKDLNQSEVLQAGRNVWAAASLQTILGLEAQLTPAIFGYSMLYPYSDNMIDDPRIDLATKKSMLKQFAALLMGRDLPVDQPILKKIKAMVQKIYGQYPMRDFPEVQQSLMTIFHGQAFSIKQSDPKTLIEDILWISAFKGGSSVLADAYLAKPYLSDAEMLASFQYGFLLQMIDDLQDMTDDQKSGSRTIFNDPSRSKDQRGRDVLRMLHYGKHVMFNVASISNAPPSLAPTIFGFLRLLTIESVARQPTQFTPEFLRQLETYSPGPLPEIAKVNIEKNMYSTIDQLDLAKLRK